jgi:hypothetical protein
MANKTNPDGTPVHDENHRPVQEPETPMRADGPGSGTALPARIRGTTEAARGRSLVSPLAEMPGLPSGRQTVSSRTVIHGLR